MTGKEKLYWALNDARNLIANGWCKGTEARLSDGRECDINNTHAAQFCIMGSINLISKSHSHRESMADCLLPFVKKFNLPSSPVGATISYFNDAKQTTLDDVLSVFDNAMDSLKESMVSESDDFNY